MRMHNKGYQPDLRYLAVVRSFICQISAEMKKAGFILLMGWVSLYSYGSMPLQVSMLEVVQNSDHVLTVQIVGVEMIDGEGHLVEDVNEMTGPGSSNTIRLLAKVSVIHLTSARSVPEIIKIPLDQFMHYSLGQIASVYEDRQSTMVVVLKGEKFEPAFAGVFGYQEIELETIMSLFRGQAQSDK